MTAIDHAWKILKERPQTPTIPLHTEDESGMTPLRRALQKLIAEHGESWADRRQKTSDEGWHLKDKHGEPQPTGMQRKETHRPVLSGSGKQSLEGAAGERDFRGQTLRDWRDKEGVDLSSYSGEISPQSRHMGHRASEEFGEKLSAFMDEMGRLAAQQHADRAESLESGSVDFEGERDLDAMVDKFHAAQGIGGGEEAPAPEAPAPARQVGPSRGQRGRQEGDVDE